MRQLSLIAVNVKFACMSSSIIIISPYCFQRIEVRDNWKKRVGIVACNSKVFTLMSFMVKNELEGVGFWVKSSIFPSSEYEVIFTYN